MPVRSRSLLLLFLGLAVAGRATAQSPNERQHLTALFDSSSATPTPKPTGALAWTRNGVLHLQAGARGDSLPLVRAGMTEFYEATVAAPRWPFPWYGLGLAKLELNRLGARVIVSNHQPAGNDWLNGARQAFLHSLRADTAFEPAIEGLVQVLIRDSLADGIAPAGALALRWATQHPVDAPTALSLARYTFLIDSLERTEQFVIRYLDAGGSPGIGAWEMARVAFATGRPEMGRTEYYKAVAHTDDPALASILHRDVALVAEPEEMAQFEHLSTAEIVPWLHEFWTKREVEAGRPAGSRLPVHFARVRYASKHFRTYNRLENYDIANIYRDAPPGLDDRGVIWIRHGEPDQRASYMRAAPNESWMYFRVTGNLTFHFAQLGSTTPRLIETLAAISPERLWWLTADSDLFESRSGLDPYYDRLAWIIEDDKRRAVRDHEMNMPSAPVQIALVKHRDTTRAMIRIGTTTDSDPIDLDRSWEPTAQVFGAPATATGSAGLVVAIALPAPDDLKPVILPGGGAGYTVRLRTTAADESGRTTVDVDSLVRLRTPRPLAKGEFLNIVGSYTLPPGTERVRVVVTDSAGERGAIRIMNGVPAVDLSQPEFALSDLIVGREGTGVRWIAPNGNAVPLHPLNAWKSTETAEVTFGIAGLGTGTPYKVRIAVADLGADSTKPPRASVEFENVASGTRDLVTQSLGLRALRPGSYLLTVTVTAGERSIKRERRVTIVPAR